MGECDLPTRGDRLDLAPSELGADRKPPLGIARQHLGRLGHDRLCRDSSQNAQPISDHGQLSRMPSKV
ncbi:hypothetical protein CQ14_37610 [Bradyrhizobium lablabi]|uniref:Uncharacterized protein n=1 Tax=Bradyrhizobium lablabi TaxID=722472 RepID=A0A0R3MBW4_9BRAD|nr:hypothetical protein CQ14_37610 [Bradyrhizobium lablabi]